MKKLEEIKKTTRFDAITKKKERLEAILIIYGFAGFFILGFSLGIVIGVIGSS